MFRKATLGLMLGLTLAASSTPQSHAATPGSGPAALPSVTGTDPEPIDPSGVAQIILAILQLA